jgi:hypothetical protein
MKRTTKTGTFVQSQTADTSHAADTRSNIEKFGLKGPQTKSYQPSDWEVVDYKMYDFLGSGVFMRGPEPAALSEPGARAEEGSIAVLGAAQIFGRFCERPVTKLVEEMTGERVYNFGYTGASPAFFLQFKELLEFLSGCRAVILQFVSARSVNNSLFQCSDRFPNRVTRRGESEGMFVNDAYKWALANVPAQKLDRAVNESRAGYVELMKQLIDAIPSKVHLLWFSDREPFYEMRFDHFNSLFGEFPQFVNEDVVSALKPHAAGYIHATTKRGRPQYLYNRFGAGISKTVDVFPRHNPPYENYYYPTPEMHEDAAVAIADAIRSGSI